MTDQAHTPVPEGTSASKIGWIVVVALMVIGMFVASLLLDAGKVYTVSSEQSWTEYESELADIDLWMVENSSGARQLEHYGAQAGDTRTIATRADNAAFIKETTAASYTNPVRAFVVKEHKRGKSVDLVQYTGTVVFTGWLPTGDSPAESSVKSLMGAPMSVYQWKPTGNVSNWMTTESIPYNVPEASRPAGATASTSRTIGIWLSAILTLCIMSFLFGDNPFYKTAEAIVVGTSAGYWMAYSFYTGIVDQLMINLFPDLVRDWTTPGLPWSYMWDWVYVIPAILGVMLVCRLLPKGGWIARWPLAFIIGATAGFRLTSHLESDFLLQIKQTITTLWAEDVNGNFDLWASVGAVTILISVLLCLVYFFFSLEHKGTVGKAARGGIFVLMITFGAAFGLTVMGRITLLTERFDFLFKDWLHLM